MKVIKKGVDIIHYKNGKVRYAPFVVWKGVLFNTKEYASTYYSTILVGKRKAYENPFISEREGIETLNWIVNITLKLDNEIEGERIIRTEIKYINE